MTKNLPYDRAERVAGRILQIVIECMHTKLTDPRLSGARPTRVRMTKDLQIARVYYHLDDASDQAKQRVENGLASAKGVFKRAIAEELNLKFTPDIEFYYDDTVDLIAKIDGLVGRSDSHA